MPFACAKAVTATFCYNIRHALTPIFGREFADTCTHPTDAMFANFKIDSSVIQACTVETNRWLQRADARFTPGSSREPSEAPGTPRTGLMVPWKRLKAKVTDSATFPESGYGTDTDWSDCTPNMSPTTSWAAVDKPRAGTPQGRAAEARAAESLMMLSSPKGKASLNSKEIPRSVSCVTTPEKEGGKRAYDVLEEDNEISDSSSPDDMKLSLGEDRKENRLVESSAALLLLQLRGRRATADTICEHEHRDKRPRRSSVPHRIP
jgi:hypothetical protein